MDKNRTCSYGRKGVRMSNCIIFNGIFWNFRTVKIPMQGPTEKQTSLEYCPTLVLFSIEIFMRLNKIVVTEKHELEERHLSKIKTLFGMFWNIKFPMERTESAVFAKKCFSTS